MFNIPNLFTSFNLLLGALSIILSLSGRIDLAPFAIFGGLICDFLDGFLARKLNKQGELGKQLDSLADMVTFGLAPGVMMMVTIIASIYMEFPVFEGSFQSYVHHELLNWQNAIFYGVPNMMDASIMYLPFVALFIPFMSMFRLAKFNIDTRQSEKFIGVPTPLNTFFFCFFPLGLAQGFDIWKMGDELYNVIFDPYVMTAWIIPMSILLVAEIPLISLKFKHFHWTGNEFRYIFLISCGILIPVLMVWSIPLIVFLYLILSLTENFIHKQKQHEV